MNIKSTQTRHFMWRLYNMSEKDRELTIKDMSERDIVILISNYQYSTFSFDKLPIDQQKIRKCEEALRQELINRGINIR